MFGLEMQGNESSLAESEARQWLVMVGLSRFEDSYPDELSGGMKPRVVIARALANNPKVLIMDEPFGVLDALARGKMQSYLRQIWKRVEVTILFITHDLDDLIYTPSGDDEEEVEKLPVIKMIDVGDDVE